MKLLKSLAKVVLIVVVIFGAYVAGLMFKVVPQNLTPQVLFGPQYADFKADLAKRVAANPNAVNEKTLLDAMNKMEDSYKPASAAPKKGGEMPTPAPAPGVPAVAPAPDVPAATTTTSPSATSTTTTATTPTTTTTTTPGQDPGAVDKAKAVVNQYQNSIDQQKQALDNL